jgi:hypothetical protein
MSHIFLAHWKIKEDDVFQRLDDGAAVASFPLCYA